MTITEVPEAIRAAIVAHCEREYPKEACGLLIAEGEKLVEAIPMTNVHEHPGYAYTISPQEMVRALRSLPRSLEMVGAYHSHPDHAAKPSAEDRRLAHGNLLYMIVRVNAGLYADYDLWRPA